MGFGLVYLPAIVSVTCYFEKYRSLATGIAVCGSGLGTFIFAPLTEFFVDEYGWRGALLLISSLVLQCTTFGALFRPVEQYQNRKVKKPSSHVNETNQRLLNKDGSAHDVDGVSDVEKRNGSSSNNHAERPVSMGNFSLSKQNSLKPMTKNNDERTMSESNNLARSHPALVNTATTSQSSDSKQMYGSSHSGVMDRKDVFYSGSVHSLHQL